MKIRGFYPYWRFDLAEKAYNRASEDGWILQKAGVFSNTYTSGGTAPCRHAITHCTAPKGSATRMQTRLAWQRAGWETVCERGSLVVYRTASDAKPPQPSGMFQLLRRRIYSLELIRIVLLVLAVILIMFGYAIDIYMIVRASVIPLVLALLLTLLISRMQKAKAYAEA